MTAPDTVTRLLVTRCPRTATATRANVSTLLRSTVWARRPVRIVGGLDIGTGFAGPPSKEEMTADASPAMNVSAPALMVIRTPLS